MKKTVFTLLVCLSASAQSGAYKCTVDGKTVYQQMPCENGEAMTLRTKPATPVANEPDSVLRESAQQQLEQLQAEREALEAKRLAEKQRREELRIERDKAKAAARQAKALEEQNELIRRGYAR